jgi:putative monooxygenase
MVDASRRKASVHDTEVNRRRGGEIRVLLSPNTVGASAGFMGVLCLAAGEHVTEHYHPYSEHGPGVVPLGPV